MKDRNINTYKKDNKSIETPEVPSYYIGEEGLHAIDVVHQFNLSYDLGTACCYILRAKNKHEDYGEECIKKAIHHLEYELKVIRKVKKNK